MERKIVLDIFDLEIQFQVTFPDGVIFMVGDRRTTHKSGRSRPLRSEDSSTSSNKKAFQGKEE